MQVPQGAPHFRHIAALTDQTSYEWQVRAYCTVDGLVVSNWSVKDTFGTYCQPPAAHWTWPIAATTATLNWVAVDSASKYEIRHRIVGNTGWTTTLIDNALHDMTYIDAPGLQESTTYEWEIRSWCTSDGNVKSGYTGVVTFTTTFAGSRGWSANRQLGEDKSNEPFQKLRIYPNPAKDRLIVKITGIDDCGSWQFVLFDVNGRRHDFQIAGNSNSSIHELDIRALSNGIYQLQVWSSEWVVSERLVIAR